MRRGDQPERLVQRLLQRLADLLRAGRSFVGLRDVLRSHGAVLQRHMQPEQLVRRVFLRSERQRCMRRSGGEDRRLRLLLRLVGHGPQPRSVEQVVPLVSGNCTQWALPQSEFPVHSFAQYSLAFASPKQQYPVPQLTIQPKQPL
jgi:hypothetical protein